MTPRPWRGAITDLLDDATRARPWPPRRARDERAHPRQTPSTPCSRCGNGRSPDERDRCAPTVAMVAHRLAARSATGVGRYYQELIRGVAAMPDLPYRVLVATTREPEAPVGLPPSIEHRTIPGHRKLVTLGWAALGPSPRGSCPRPPHGRARAAHVGARPDCRSPHRDRP